MPIEVIIDKPIWRDHMTDTTLLAEKCHTAVKATCRQCEGEVSLLLTDNERMRTLNHDFRKQDKPTNVLSFPGEPNTGHLGDIAIGFEICEREAKERDILFNHHIAHLIVHGLLHLIGYDHINEQEAEEMEALEVQILAKLGIDNPYQETEIY